MDTTPSRGPAAPAALLLAALLLDGCASLNPTPAPALHERLDALHASARPAWRDEMRRLLHEKRQGIPEKHLALALDAFNNGTDRTLLVETMWRYLDERRGAGPRLDTDADRRLLHVYAETALRSRDTEHRRRLETLCLTLDAEPACVKD